MSEESLNLVYQKRDDDCFRACISTLLSIPYEEIKEPDIKLPTDKWLQEWRLFLNSNGYDIIFLSYTAHDEWMPRGYSIGIGISPRGKDHAVICLDGKPFFDPYQNSTGFPDSFSSYGLISLINPSSLRTELEVYKAALEKYGDHLDQCGMMRMVCPKKNKFTKDAKCMCGLDEALQTKGVE